MAAAERRGHRRAPDVKVTTDVLPSADADLLVVGARRCQGHLGLQLGPLAHAVPHHSACPVAVVAERA
ncbi:universal stress protein [Streptomyces sp. R41]|uniref:Universal stress protein n=1 Tax=Streptomyces sp. R41 TaxID=3238632 RepID=A0AB39RNT7_9ACTN